MKNFVCTTSSYSRSTEWYSECFYFTCKNSNRSHPLNSDETGN